MSASIPDILSQSVGVNLGQRDRLFGENCQAGDADIGEPATDEYPLAGRRFGPSVGGGHHGRVQRFQND